MLLALVAQQHTDSRYIKKWRRQEQRLLPLSFSLYEYNVNFKSALPPLPFSPPLSYFPLPLHASCGLHKN